MLSLVYSGNFLAEVEVEPFGTARVRIGIDPEPFAWALEPGAEFTTPEAVSPGRGDGLGGISDALHRLFRERLARGHVARPAATDRRSTTGRATYFDFDADRLVEIAPSARTSGSSCSSSTTAGSASATTTRARSATGSSTAASCPTASTALAREIEDLGVAVRALDRAGDGQQRSELFAPIPTGRSGSRAGRGPRAASSWSSTCRARRSSTTSSASLSDVLGSGPISYVKWDMNRCITEPWSAALPPDRQGEFFHRYILGVYDLYDRLTRALPGHPVRVVRGRRRAVRRRACSPTRRRRGRATTPTRSSGCAIQWGTSLAYPLSSMGAHVSAVPNHQVGRDHAARDAGRGGVLRRFGYELDPTALSDEERPRSRDQVAFYKQRRELFQRGRFVRLRSPFEGDGNEIAWMVVSEHARAAIVGWYQVLNRPVPPQDRLRLRGLEPASSYIVTTLAVGGRQPGARERGSAARR